MLKARSIPFFSQVKLLVCLSFNLGGAIEIAIATNGNLVRREVQVDAGKAVEIAIGTNGNVIRRALQPDALQLGSLVVAPGSKTQEAKRVGESQQVSLVASSSLDESQDCVWSNWAEWSRCSEECDLGYKTRARRVKIQLSGRGAQCQGPSQETAACNERPCAANNFPTAHLAQVGFHSSSSGASMASVSEEKAIAKLKANQTSREVTVPEGIAPYLNLIYSVLDLFVLALGVYILVKVYRAPKPVGQEDDGDAAEHFGEDLHGNPLDSFYGDGGEFQDDPYNPGNPMVVPPKKKAKSKPFCTGRRCKICFGSFLVFFAVAAFLGLWVIGPIIAEAIMGGAEITFNKLTLVQVLSKKSLMANAVVTISNIVLLGGTLADCDMTVMYDDKPFGTLAFPSSTVHPFEDNRILIHGAMLTITHEDNWNECMRAIIENESVDWRIKAEVQLSTFVGVPVVLTDVPLDKTVPLKGLDGMKDIKVLALNMAQSRPDDIVIVLKACMRNPSDIEIMSLGDLYLEIFFEGASMGEVTSKNTKIKVAAGSRSSPECRGFGHGYNYLEMGGTIKPADPEACDQLISKYLSGEGFHATAKAMSPMAVSIPLFNGALQGFQLGVDVTGNREPLITKLDITSLMLDPADDFKALGSLAATVTIDSPLGKYSGLQPLDVDITMNMSYNKSFVGTIATGKFKLPNVPMIKGEGKMNISTKFELTLDNKGIELAKMAKALIKAKSRLENDGGLKISVSGSATLTAEVEALHHPLKIVGVPVKFPSPATYQSAALLPLTLKGMDGLNRVTILNYTIPGNVKAGGPFVGGTSGMILEATAQIINPSQVGLTLATLNTKLKNKAGVELGQLSAHDVTLKTGKNAVSMKGKLDPKGDAAIRATEQFLEQYIKNNPQTLKVSGVDAGDGPEWLNDVASNLHLHPTFPGISWPSGKPYSILDNVKIWSLFINPFGFKVRLRMSFVMQLPSEPKANIDMSIVLGIFSAGVVMDMIDVKDGQTFAQVSATPGKATIKYDARTSKCEMILHWVPLRVVQAGKLGKIVAKLIFGKSGIKFTGLVTPVINTNVGPLTLKDVPVHGRTALASCQLIGNC